MIISITMLAGVAMFSGVAAGILHNADKTAKEQCAAEAENATREAYQGALEEAEANLETYSHILNREKREKERRVAAWEKDTKWKGRKWTVNDDAKKALRAIEIDPDSAENRMYAEVKEQAKVALGASKRALAYDTAKRNRDKSIKEIEAEFRKTCDMLSLYATDPTMASQVSVLRAAADKKRADALEKANAVFDEIESKYKAKQAEWDERVLEAKTRREEMLIRERDRINDEKDKQLSALESERIAAIRSIEQDIEANRTPEERRIAMSYEDSSDVVETAKKNEMLTAANYFADMTLTDKLVSYFKAKQTPIVAIVALGMLPIAGLLFAGWKWVVFLAGIVKGVSA